MTYPNPDPPVHVYGGTNKNIGAFTTKVTVQHEAGSVIAVLDLGRFSRALLTADDVEERT